MKGNRQLRKNKDEINMECFKKNRKIFKQEAKTRIERFNPFTVDEMIRNFNKLNKKKEVRK